MDIDKDIRLIDSLVGQTPLRLIQLADQNFEIYIKREDSNKLSNSLKDRAAWNIIKNSLNEIIDKKLTVVESSSGNFAISLGQLSKVFGFELFIFANPKRLRNPLVIAKLESLGVRIVSASDPRSEIKKTIALDPDRYFWPDQYDNPLNLEAHYVTGQEVINDLKSFTDSNIDLFFASLGTTGSSRGIAKVLKQANPGLKTFGVVPMAGNYIQGLRTLEDLQEVPLFNPSVYDGGVIECSETDARNGHKDLLDVGIDCGFSSGAVYYAVKKYMAEHPPAGSEKLRILILGADNGINYQ